jgi:hypothetical protein
MVFVMVYKFAGIWQSAPARGKLGTRLCKSGGRLEGVSSRLIAGGGETVAFLFDTLMSI